MSKILNNLGLCFGLELGFNVNNHLMKMLLLIFITKL
jgi:hypothetical protein